MTVQAPERLLSEKPEIDFGSLSLYAIIVGDIRKNHGWGDPYPFDMPPVVPPGGICSALWRGYVATFRLRPDGCIELKRYDYPNSRPRFGVDVLEVLKGDFWLIMKAEFFGPRVYVPFVAGQIVSDDKKWIVEDGTELELIRRFQEPRVEERVNIPLETPVFLGVISKLMRDEEMEEWVWVQLDREIPRKHFWCACDLVRDSKAMVRTRFSGSRGLNMWHLRGLTPDEVLLGDELWAQERQPGVE